MKIVINPIRPALCESANQDFHLLVRLQSEPQAGFKRTPLNLALVIDRSGSMQGPKLTEAKRCVTDLVGRMSPLDLWGLMGVLGLGLRFATAGDFSQGLGIALVLFAGVGLMVDGFAERRAYTYESVLQGSKLRPHQ